MTPACPCATHALGQMLLVVQQVAADGEIVDYAKRNPFNLIVLSTHERSGMNRWAYGQVVDKVLQRSTSPVFLVRPQ